MFTEFSRWSLGTTSQPPGWEQLGWSKSWASLFTRTLSRREILITWARVVEVELRWADRMAETRRWTHQYLGRHTHNNCPVLNSLFAFLQHSTCSEKKTTHTNWLKTNYGFECKTANDKILRRKLKWKIFVPLVCFLCSVAQACPTLCNPMDCSPTGSFVHAISWQK